MNSLKQFEEYVRRHLEPLTGRKWTPTFETGGIESEACITCDPAGGGVHFVLASPHPNKPTRVSPGVWQVPAPLEQLAIHEILHAVANQCGFEAVLDVVLASLGDSPLARLLNTKFENFLSLLARGIVDDIQGVR